MDERSRRVVVVAHCILNANAKYLGGASYRGANLEFLQPRLNDGVGIVQLPCPESSFLGMSRWSMTRNQYDTVAYRRHCAEILGPTLDTLEEFRAAGYEIEAVYGVQGSPSCGVTRSCTGYVGGEVSAAECASIAGSGVYMTVLDELLRQRGMDINLRDVVDPEGREGEQP